MSAIEKVLGRRGPVRINHLGKHTWGPNPRRVVRVHVFEDGTGIHAVIYGAQGRSVFEIERFDDVAAAERRPNGRVVDLTLVLGDGRRLDAPHGGCGCGSPLKAWVPPGIARVGT